MWKTSLLSKHFWQRYDHHTHPYTLQYFQGVGVFAWFFRFWGLAVLAISAADLAGTPVWTYLIGIQGGSTVSAGGVVAGLAAFGVSFMPSTSPRVPICLLLLCIHLILLGTAVYNFVNGAAVNLAFATLINLLAVVFLMITASRKPT
jgi:hypothetical protein